MQGGPPIVLSWCCCLAFSSRDARHFQLGTLAVLQVISLNIDCRRAITDLGGVQQLVDILDDPARDLQILAAGTIANVCKIRKARKIVRKSGGIPKLVRCRDAAGRTAPGLPTHQASLPRAAVPDAAGAGKKSQLTNAIHSLPAGRVGGPA